MSFSRGPGHEYGSDRCTATGSQHLAANIATFGLTLLKVLPVEQADGGRGALQFVEVAVAGVRPPPVHPALAEALGDDPHGVGGQQHPSLHVGHQGGAGLELVPGDGAPGQGGAGFGQGHLLHRSHRQGWGGRGACRGRVVGDSDVPLEDLPPQHLVAHILHRHKQGGEGWGLKIWGGGGGVVQGHCVTQAKQEVDIETERET